ncbi:hypothetical protein ACFLZW_02340 [Chloroflexota bacterium]
MPRYIDPDTINVDDLPGIWSPVQWELSEEERIAELHVQAIASLLWAIDIPEAVLRLFLNETDIERTFDPPDGFDPEVQGEWDPDLVTFKFKRSIQLESVEREPNYLYAEYKFGDLGYFALEIEPDKVSMYRI